jgi:transcriptional regulator with XRE-family HTH domain
MSQKASHQARYLALVSALKALRLERGLTQHQVAHALGKYPAYVSKVELAERRLDPIELVDLLTFYRVPLNKFKPLKTNEK